MRIVIDLQGAQSTGSRNRGIGRYTLSLAQAIIRNRGNHEVFLALNGLFPDTIESIRTAFDDLLPQKNICIWQVPGPVHSTIKEDNWRKCCAELVREAFLINLKPDVLIISSLFEGGGDNTVTSIGAFTSTIPTAVILYDLIPLIYRNIYLKDPTWSNFYESKLGHLRRADLLLAISESSRQEGVRYLNFTDEACVNISTAADIHFKPKKVNKELEAEVRQRYGLLKSFIMYTGGIDHRKNIEGLIRAYAQLSKELRGNHQLAIVCSIQPTSQTALETLTKEVGLNPDELVLTGFVSEKDLLTLYNLCKVFVFPSWHEGFGLPALEAMSCGRAVIGANTSSLPEVIGRDDALFDPLNDTAITVKLAQVLTDDIFRAELEQHGLKQAKQFSWDASAQRAILALETLHAKKVSFTLKGIISTRRPKLAYVSPLPPERSGISDYSAELLPDLSRHYDIDLIVAQDFVSNPWINANCRIRSVEWLKDHANSYDRVLYHFGNSHFHQHMFNLLEEVPGVVVLHDFFLSGPIAHMDVVTNQRPGYWSQTLYQSHGYSAVQQQFHAPDTWEVARRYPCNLVVIKNALGVIVHSENSLRLASQYYGDRAADKWMVIPLLRNPVISINRIEARHQLKLNLDDFVVCSFGLLNATKLNQRLLDAWLKSSLSKNKHCKLVFVGENNSGEYGAMLLKTIKESGMEKYIFITGWVDTTIYSQYLAAADIGVQLRALSRGETSAAVLDCMNYGLPTIVNINGSMADLPDDGVLKLTDEFDDAELTCALETLWQNPDRRQQLGRKARDIILSQHNPRHCANQYVQAIEVMYQDALTGISGLTTALASVVPLPDDPDAIVRLAEAVALSIQPRLSPRQMLVDISSLVQSDIQSDMRKKTCEYLQKLLGNPPEGFRIEPVYSIPDDGYRYARRFTLRLLDCPESVLIDDPIEFHAGDQFWGLDFQLQVDPAKQDFYQKLRNYGVQVKFNVPDLIDKLSLKLN